MSKRPVSTEKPSKRQELREKHRKQERQQRALLIVMIVIGALLIGFALIWPTLKPVGEIATVTPNAYTAQVEMTSIGDPNAPVRVDIWEDFQCPACKRFTEEVETEIIKNYVETGKVLYTFHHYAFIDSQVTSKESQQSANASMCAAAQGKFWDMHSTIYANWNGENQGAYSNKRLVAFAESVGVDMAAFKTCFNRNEYKTEIDADFEMGQNWGVGGTPTVFVDGVKVGDQYVPGYSEIAASIESALKGK